MVRRLLFLPACHHGVVAYAPLICTSIDFPSPMKALRRSALLFCFSVAPWMVACGGPLPAAEPGWSPVIVARGSYRHRIEATPLHLRPYRPLHFYGNTLRRDYYRGNPLPTLGDVNQTLRLMLTGPTVSPVR